MIEAKYIWDCSRVTMTNNAYGSQTSCPTGTNAIYSSGNKIALRVQSNGIWRYILGNTINKKIKI